MSAKDWVERDFYKVLGIAKDASADEVKKAYRKLARQLHPDHNPGDAESERRFKDVSEAYSVLSDPRKRKEYDEMRSLFGAGAFRRGAGAGAGAGPGGMPFDLGDLFRDRAGAGAPGGFSAGGGFSDLLGSMFGGAARARRGPTRGRDVEAEVALSFDEAVRGATIPLTLRAPGVCDTCHGNGAKPGTTPRTCASCHGSGLVTSNQGSFSFAEPCRECRGVGTLVDEKCPECGGSGGVTKSRTLRVKIPPGVVEGQRVRLKGKGEPGERGGPAGDLYVVAHVRGDSLFGRSGDNLTLTVPITFPEAALGTDLRVPTLDGSVGVRVPPGTPSGRTFRVRGKGGPRRDGAGTGDLLVTVDVVVPQELSEAARKALADFDAASSGALREKIDAEVRRRGR
ncbi:MAG: molecular chaperone DnaJ [Micromonosporaceae bacterium]